MPALIGTRFLPARPFVAQLTRGDLARHAGAAEMWTTVSPSNEIMHITLLNRLKYYTSAYLAKKMKPMLELQSGAPQP